MSTGLTHVELIEGSDQACLGRLWTESSEVQKKVWEAIRKLHSGSERQCHLSRMPPGRTLSFSSSSFPNAYPRASGPTPQPPRQHTHTHTHTKHPAVSCSTLDSVGCLLENGEFEPCQHQSDARRCQAKGSLPPADHGEMFRVACRQGTTTAAFKLVHGVRHHQPHVF
jgi:hypothetical protein